MSRSWLRTIVEDSSTANGRIFDVCVQILVLVSVVTFTVETLPDLSVLQRNLLATIETVLILIFTVEYLVRVWVAKARLQFMFSFYGIIDLLSILPFYIALGLDLRALRAFRLLRLFQVLKLARYSQTLSRISLALRIAREELFLFVSIALVVIYLASVGIYHFENVAQPEAFSSVPAAFWWAVVTLTTVGYGDVYPITVGGKIFTSGILFIGLGLVAVPAGIIASALSRAREIQRGDDSTT